MMVGRESLGVRSSNHVGNEPVVLPWRSLGVRGQIMLTRESLGVSGGQIMLTRESLGVNGGQIILTRQSLGVNYHSLCSNNCPTGSIGLFGLALLNENAYTPAMSPRKFAKPPMKRRSRKRRS